MIQRIDNASSRQELVRALERGWQAKTSMTSTRAHKTRGIVYKNGSMRMGTFQILNEEQAIEKDKIMQKLALLERKGKMSTVIPNTTSNDRNENASSRMLSSTIGSAFASCEVIHYGEIKRENIIEIPKEIIDAIENNRNKEYQYEYKSELELTEQPMLPETKATLFNLYRDYLCSEEQKEIIIKSQEKERKELQKNKLKEEKEKKHFNMALHDKNARQDKEEDNQENTSNMENQFSKNLALVKKEKDSIFAKCIRKIKRFFKQ